METPAEMDDLRLILTARRRAGVFAATLAGFEYDTSNDPAFRLALTRAAHAIKAFADEIDLTPENPKKTRP